MARDVEGYKKLIRSNPIEAKDGNGASLLRIAIAYSSEPIALDLVDRGVEIEQLDRKSRSEIQNAFYKGFWELGRRLIDRGANLRHFDSYGNNALWYASTHPRPDYELVRHLVEKGSEVSTKNQAGRSPLDAAKEMGDAKMIEILEAGEKSKNQN